MRAARIGSVVAVAVVAAAGAGGARADGLPVVGIDVGADGVAAGQRPPRHAPGRRDTLVARVARSGGRVLRSRLLRGTFTIPAVAYDRSAGGLTADGRTLALIAPRAGFPRAETALLVLDARRLAVAPARAAARRLQLRRDLARRAPAVPDPVPVATRPDAATPSASTTCARGRLAPRPVVDPHEAGEKMQGVPLSRAASGDGRWAFTLYQRQSAAPFVHALDTREPDRALHRPRPARACRPLACAPSPRRRRKDARRPRPRGHARARRHRDVGRQRSRQVTGRDRTAPA